MVRYLYRDRVRNEMIGDDTFIASLSIHLIRGTASLLNRRYEGISDHPLL